MIIATDGSTAAALTLAPGLVPPAWHPVTTFYYRVPASPLGAPVLVIDGDGDLLLNATVLSDVAPGYAPPGTSLVAASVPGRADPALEPEVRSRLARMYDTGTRGLGAAGDLRRYPAPCPSCRPASRWPARSGSGRAAYVCGDHRDTPSIQGALVSRPGVRPPGRPAAPKPWRTYALTAAAARPRRPGRCRWIRTAPGTAAWPSRAGSPPPAFGRSGRRCTRASRGRQAVRWAAAAGCGALAASVGVNLS